MKTLFYVLLSIASLFITRTASAWDAPELWYDPAQGAKASPYDVSPGGGGIIGTGGQTDYGITCASCHTSGAQNYGSISVDFTPAFNGQYVPGQTYAITATLKGEHLGVTGCDPNMDNRNQIAVTFEDDATGKVAGVLAGDYGSSASCPTTPPPQGFTGSTFVWKDCHAIIANTMNNKTSWTFKWTAPAQGSGGVTMYYGAVDGDCGMSSLGDDVKTGTMKLSEKTARLDAPTPSRSMYAMLGFVPVLAGVFSRRRRK
jgi:hypothetical protein